MSSTDYSILPSSGPAIVYTSKQSIRTSNHYRLLGVPFNIWILVCICFLTFGSYWVYDTPGALEHQFKEWFGSSYSDASNDALYSVYSFPNCVLPLFGGYFVDKLTVRKSCLLFLCLITLGELIFCLGIETRGYWVCLLGRFVFGLGGESLTVAQNTYTIRWFDGKQLALVFGLVVAFSRVGTSVNFIVSPLFAKAPYGVPFSCWFGCLMCGVSLMTAIIAGQLDRWASDKIDSERATHFRTLPKKDRKALLKEDARHEPANDEVNLKDIRYFPVEAWLLFVITMFFYIAILTFNTVAQSILTNTGNHYDDDTAGIYMSIPSFVAIGASPLFGFLVDRVGRGLYWVAFAALGMMFAHVYYLMMAYDIAFTLTLGPIPIMIWIGIFYSMGASSLWPILSFILDKKITGTGYGVMTSIQNFGLGLFPLMIGGIQTMNGISDTKLKYTVPIFVFIGCTIVALLLTLLLIRIDSQSGSRLNASAADRQAKMLEEQAASQDSMAHSRESDSLIAAAPLDGPVKQRKSATKTAMADEHSINNDM